MRTTTPGCKKACCASGPVPPKPYRTSWTDYAPCLTGTQIMAISTSWERTYARNTRQEMRQAPTGWPADLGKSDPAAAITENLAEVEAADRAVRLAMAGR